MIEPAVGIGGDGEALSGEQGHDPLRERRIARCGIAHVEQRLGEIAEIMDRRRRGRGGDRHPVALELRVVMRRDDQDRARTRQAGAQPGEEVPRRAGLERHHRRAVGEKEARQTAHRGQAASFAAVFATRSPR